MTDAELAARADANYAYAWRTVDGYAPRGEVVERDGVLLASCGLPVAQFNLVFVTGPLNDPVTAIAAAAAWFDERELPFVLRVREGVDAATERACEEQGLQFRDVLPGLVMRITVLPDPDARLAIRTATAGDSMQQHRQVLATAFGFPLEVAEAIFSTRLAEAPGCELFVGFVDGTPITSSALIMSDGVAGVYNVGCLPDARRQGYGEAMTWHAIRRGLQLGCDIASLQSSEMGRLIYERMGFRLVAPYRTFVRGHVSGGGS